MRSYILPPPLLIFFLAEGSISGHLQLLIIDVLKLIIERTVMLRRDLCNSLMEDHIGLVINTHQLALKGPVVLCGHSHPLADVVLLQFVLGCLFLHCLSSRVDYLYRWRR